MITVTEASGLAFRVKKDSDGEAIFRLLSETLKRRARVTDRTIRSFAFKENSENFTFVTSGFFGSYEVSLPCDFEYRDLFGLILVDFFNRKLPNREIYVNEFTLDPSGATFGISYHQKIRDSVFEVRATVEFFFDEV